MKKVLLIVLCVISVAGAQAQARFGLKAGLNIANLTGDDFEDVKSKLGFNVGAFAEVPLASSLSFRPEVVFSSQGAKDGDEKLNLGYVNVPLLAKYTSTGGFFAETGPQIGFLLSAKAKDGDDEEDIKEFLKSTDLAWAFGLGYHITPSIGINARYNLGLSKVLDNDNADGKNSVFQVGLFYNFGTSSTVKR